MDVLVLDRIACDEIDFSLWAYAIISVTPENTAGQEQAKAPI